MKKYLTGNIGSAIGAPLKKGTLDHLQDAYTEITAASIISRISGYQQNVAYRLFGVELELGPIKNTVSAGAIFYSGEVYYVDKVIIPKETNLGKYICKIAKSYLVDQSADPVTFSNGANYNVHEIQKVSVVLGPINTGVFNYIDIKNIVAPNVQIDILGTGGAFLMDFRSNKFVMANPQDDGAFTVNFDFTDAKIGSQTILSTGTRSTVQVTFQQGATIKPVIGYGRSNPVILPSVSGAVPGDRLIITGTYVGIDPYGVRVVKIDLNFS